MESQNPFEKVGRICCAFIFWGIATGLTGCEPRGFYPLKFERILREQRKLPGEVVIIQGSRFGPFKEGPVAIGGLNLAGRLHTETKYGVQPPVKWPAVPGYYFVASSYVNEGEECLYVVRKIKAGLRDVPKTPSGGS